MSNKFIDVSNMVSIEDMLSSTTYSTQASEVCVYCYKEVEDDSFKYDNNFYSPHRCDCQKAQSEILIKEDVLKTLKSLETLNENINAEKISSSIYDTETIMAEEYKKAQRRNI